MINLEKLNSGTQEVKFNQKTLGHFIMQDDGYYVFCAQNSLEGWSSYSLKLVAKELDKINSAFEQEVNNYFDEQRRDMEERARVEYRKLLNESGMFFEFYPHLTGDWKKDKLEWFDIYKELE